MMKTTLDCVALLAAAAAAAAAVIATDTHTS